MTNTAKKKAMEGVGTTLLFTESQLTLNIRRIRRAGIERGAIEVTSLDAEEAGPGGYGNRDFIFSKLVDPGSLELEVYHDPDFDLHTLLGREAELLVLTYPRAAKGEIPASEAALGGVTAVNWDIAQGEAMVASITVKLAKRVAQSPSQAAVR